jgi:hypothetical protein
MLKGLSKAVFVVMLIWFVVGPAMAQAPAIRPQISPFPQPPISPFLNLARGGARPSITTALFDLNRSSATHSCNFSSKERRQWH